MTARVQLHLLDPFIQCDTAKPLFPTGFALGFLSLVSGACRRQVMDPGLWLPSPVATSPPFHSCCPLFPVLKAPPTPCEVTCSLTCPSQPDTLDMSLTLKGVGFNKVKPSPPWVPRGFWTGLHFEAQACSHCLTIILENEHTKTNVLRFLIPTKCVHYS